MKPTDDIAPLADLAEREFSARVTAALDALTALQDVWSRLYGPNEALAGAFDDIAAMQRDFYEEP